MATVAKPRKPKADVHPDQLEVLISANALPCEVQALVPSNDMSEWKASAKLADKLLRTVAGELRDAQNAMVAEWLGYHYVAGASGIAVPTDLFLAMYHAARPACPNTLTECVTLALNWLVHTIKTQQSPRSELKRWQAVLSLYRKERAWHWDEPQPIRLSPKNCAFEFIDQKIYLVVSAHRDSKVRLRIKGEVATTREAGPGRNGQKYNERIKRLRLDQRLARTGAQLQEKRGKWYFTFLDRVAAPRLPVVASPNTMRVRTSDYCGWRVCYRSRAGKWMRDRVVGRQELAMLAEVRCDHIARRVEMKLRGLDVRSREVQDENRRWNNYCSTLIGQSVSDVIALAVSEGIERIQVMAGDEWCALGQAGNEERRQAEPTRFPFNEFALKMKQKGMAQGIVVETRANLRSYKRRKARWSRRLNVGLL